MVYDVSKQKFYTVFRAKARTCSDENITLLTEINSQLKKQIISKHIPVASSP